MRCFIVFSILLVLGASINLDIYLKPPAYVTRRAEEIDEKCHEIDPSDDIFLRSRNFPHITLYLTDFLDDRVDDVVYFVEEIAKIACPVHGEMLESYTASSYFMWNVSKPDSMQLLSDSLVKVLSPLREKGEPIPEWIFSLPEPEKTEKIIMYELFGSPNVFSQFQPHMSIAWDSDVTKIETLQKEVQVPNIPFLADTIVIGIDGDHGAVMRGKDIASFPLLCGR